MTDYPWYAWAILAGAVALIAIVWGWLLWRRR